HEAIELVWLQKMFTTKVATALLIPVVILSVIFMLPNDDIFPIDKVLVSGDYKQINKSNINKKLHAYLGKGFFAIDIKSIQQSISLEPWIKTVSVKRIWPSELHVHLIEKTAVARWDKDHLLSQQAVIFEADSKQFSHLPLISGYSGRSRQLLHRYSEMQQEFSRHGIQISEMSEDSKGALSLLLNKKLKVNIGSENNEIKIQHLLAVYSQQIKPRVEKIKHIDFRYSNGFSIAWKEELTEQLDGAKKRSNKNV
ncbi:MAG: cell division protein FtsQ/DivIB, partial [Gammaproteobacteria bacterium]|nr:cell division protein FtsQ/DivIB [Gammaproteobacteria bacterium]